MRYFIRPLVPLAALVLVGGRPAREQPRSDVLQVVARNCAGNQSRAGTGFAWGSATRVVTALHVVAGCQTLSVFSERDQRAYPATLVSVLRRADLALVEVQGGASFPPLVHVVAQPAVNTNLTAWGYGEGIPAMRDFSPLRVASGGSTLQQNLPPRVATELSQIGSPALNIDVVPIDAPLAAGLSGAPLLDGSGRVRAIADGGVGHGITHVSWAIPASYLVDLAQSQESAAGLVAPNANLSAVEVARADVFSADVADATAPSVNCGSATLRLAGTRSLGEAQAGSDSPIGLQQLAATFPGVSPALPFDVYEDAATGATVAVPAGAALAPQGNFCRASLDNGRIDLIVSVTSIPNGSTPDLIASQFEQLIAPPATGLWMLDQSWSYFMPFVRADGLIVRRKAFGHAVPNVTNKPTEYLFETLAARNGTFIGVAGIRHDDFALNMCMMGAVPPGGCPPPDYLPTWAHVAFSVHLATFAITASRQAPTPWQQMVAPAAAAPGP